MDWLQGMNSVIGYIEENLTQPIAYESLSRMVGCSVYEFSRIFSFMAGISISEYIRRRRLSQAVFDIQHSGEKIIDIALKYGYEWPATFTRAFKELHGATPSAARQTGVSLKTYPPITFVLTIKGVNEMDFRMEKRDSFQIIGYACDDANGEAWKRFMESCNKRLWNGDAWDNPQSYYHAPFWQVGAYEFRTKGCETGCIIGAELGNKPVLDGMDVEPVPAADWAVFTITSKTGGKEAGEAYTRILSEWLPASQYARNESAPTLEVYLPGDANSDKYQWEIWLPVKNR